MKVVAVGWTPPRSVLTEGHSSNKILPWKQDDITYIDRELAKMFVSTNVPLKLLQNKHFGNIFKRYILNGRYALPKVDYMNESVIHNMFQDTKADVKKLLNNVRHLALCVDAWGTSTNVSYITLRDHAFDPYLDLQS